MAGLVIGRALVGVDHHRIFHAGARPVLQRELRKRIRRPELRIELERVPRDRAGVGVLRARAPARYTMWIGIGPLPGIVARVAFQVYLRAVAHAKSFTMSATRCHTRRSPGGRRLARSRLRRRRRS